MADPVYEVSRDGRVFSVTSNWRGYGEREMLWKLDADGYPRVRVIVNGKRISRFVHALVAQKYLPPQPSPMHQIRHLDGNKLNPGADNLEWGTPKENADDRERHGRTSRGDRHSNAIKNSPAFQRHLAGGRPGNV